MFQFGMEFNPYGLFHGLFIPNCIAQSNLLSDQEKLLMGRLYQYAGRNGRAFPSRTKLAVELSWELRKLDRVISKLKQKKLVKTSQATSQSTSEYLFLWHEIYVAKLHEIPVELEQTETLPTVKNDRGTTVKNDNHKRGQYEKGQKFLSETNRAESSRERASLDSSNRIASRKEKETEASSKTSEIRASLKKPKQLHKETVEIIDFWNKHDSLTHHTLVRRRTVGAYATQTKTVQKANSAIYRLLRGSYYSDCTDIKQMLQTKPITVEQIKMAISRMAIAATPEYSKNPTRINILTFIQNQRLKLGNKPHNLYQWKFPLLHYLYYEPVKIADAHIQKSTPYESLVKKVIGKLNAGNVVGTKYNQVVKSVEKAVALIDRRANGNRGQLLYMLPELIYDSLLSVGKGLTVESLPLGVYRLESLMEERLMLKPQYNRGNN